MRMKQALLATVFAVSVSPALGEPINLSMYTFYTTDVSFYEQVIADYQKSHPDVTVTISTFEAATYDAALRTAFSSGNVPDLICVEPDARAVGMYPLIGADLLAPLNDLYEREGWEDKFFDSVLSQLNIDGTYYSAPVSVNNFSLFYNATMLEKYGLDVPNSYEDLLHMAEVLGKDGIYPISFGNQFPQRGRDYFYMLAGQIDHQIIKKADSGEIAWTDERLVNAAQKLKDMADDGIFMPGINAMTIVQNNEAYLTGRSAMVLSGPWDIKPFEVGAPEGVEVSLMRFPPVFDGVTEGVSPGGVGKNYAVPKKGNVEAAKDFLAYLVSEPVLTDYVEQLGIMAPYAEPNSVATDPIQVKFNELQATNVVPRVLLNANALEALGSALQGVIAGDITAEEGMQEVEDAR